MFEVTERWTSRGHQNTEGDKLAGLIREDGQFERIRDMAYWSPINWDGGDVPRGREIGRLMVDNAIVSVSTSCWGRVVDDKFAPARTSSKQARARFLRMASHRRRCSTG